MGPNSFISYGSLSHMNTPHTLPRSLKMSRISAFSSTHVLIITVQESGMYNSESCQSNTRDKKNGICVHISWSLCKPSNAGNIDCMNGTPTYHSSKSWNMGPTSFILSVPLITCLPLTLSPIHLMYQGLWLPHSHTAIFVARVPSQPSIFSSPTHLSPHLSFTVPPPLP